MVPFTVSGLTSIINQLLPEPHAGLLAGLLFGTKTSLSGDFYDALVTSGTLHIIALSGMNITIMEDLVGKMLLPVVGKRVATALTLLLIIWFVWFVGPASSIIRAAIMGSLSLIAVLFGRQYWAFLTLLLTVGIMLIIHFNWLFEISFQLSALATLGIILFSGQRKDANKTFAAAADLQNSFQRPYVFWVNNIVGKVASPVWSLMKENVRLTLAAQVFTIPLTMLYFHRLSLVSPLTNLAIGWVISPVTLAGWVTVLLGFFVLYAGQAVAWIDWLFLEYLIRTIQIMSRLPFASLGF